MMSAAVRSSFRVFAIRDRRMPSSSLPSPLMSGITATPVSNPDSPSASFGKSTSARTIIMRGWDCCANRCAVQSWTSWG